MFKYFYGFTYRNNTKKICKIGISLKTNWTDDIFRNELEAKIHNTMVPNEYIRVYPNGDVLQSVRFKIFINHLKSNFFIFIERHG